MDSGLVLPKVVNCSHYCGRAKRSGPLLQLRYLTQSAWLSWLLWCDSWKIASICMILHVCPCWTCSVTCATAEQPLFCNFWWRKMVGWVGDAGWWERDWHFLLGKKGWQQWKKLERGYSFLGQECWACTQIGQLSTQTVLQFFFAVFFYD